MRLGSTHRSADEERWREERKGGTEGGWKMRRELERIYDPVPLVSLLAVTGPQSGIAGSGAHSPEIRVMEIPHFYTATA